MSAVGSGRQSFLPCVLRFSLFATLKKKLKKRRKKIVR